jgi:hypothetical protein
VRSETFSFLMMCSTCLLTVDREMCRSAAIWRLVTPVARRTKTSSSLGVRGEDADPSASPTGEEPPAPARSVRTQRTGA